AHHSAEEYLDAYLAAAGIADDRGNAVREIKSVHDAAGTVLKYLVTVTAYSYYTSNPNITVEDAMTDGVTQANLLAGVRHYQAFGIAISFDPAAAATEHLYAGEQF